MRGRTLKMMRETHGLTSRKLAGMVGVTHSHILRVESGERAISADLLARILDTFNELPKGDAA